MSKSGPRRQFKAQETQGGHFIASFVCNGRFSSTWQSKRISGIVRSTLAEAINSGLYLAIFHMEFLSARIEEEMKLRIVFPTH